MAKTACRRYRHIAGLELDEIRQVAALAALEGQDCFAAIHEYVQAERRAGRQTKLGSMAAECITHDQASPERRILHRSHESECRRAYYERCKLAGRCPVCGRPNDRPGRVKCSKCVVRHNEANRARQRRHDRREAGLCGCGRKREDTCFRQCERCRTSQRQKSKRRRQNALNQELAIG